LQKDYSMGPDFISALILTAMNKYEVDVAPFLALSRETWGEEILWDAAKDVRYGKENRTRLMYVAKIGDLARLRWLLKRGANVNIQDTLGKTALFFACESGHLEIVRELLKYDHNAKRLETRDTFASPPLHAAIKNKHLAVAKELLSAGFSANTLCKKIWHPTALAMEISDEDLQRAFLALLDHHGSLPCFVSISQILRRKLDGHVF
jgi:ankyrin repeat protein